MKLRRYWYCRLLLLAAGLLGGGGASAQVHELPTRFYLLPRTQHRYDSVYEKHVKRRCWLLRYTERRYADAGNGNWYLDEKDRASWFFGRVTRQVHYQDDKTKDRVYRYRRNLRVRHHRPTWTAGEEFIVVVRQFRDGKLRKVTRYQDGYYLVKQRIAAGRMPGFSRALYRTGPP